MCYNALGMKILLTAGGTSTRIDRGRVLACLSPARLSARLAHAFWSRGHDLTVLTSSADTLSELPTHQSGRTALLGYETVDDLLTLLPQVLQSVAPDAVVHAAAVSEYKAAGVFTPAPGTTFHTRVRRWDSTAGPPELLPLDPFAETPPDEQWVRLSRGPRVIERRTLKRAGLLIVVSIRTTRPALSYIVIECSCPPCLIRTPSRRSLR